MYETYIAVFLSGWLFGSIMGIPGLVIVGASSVLFYYKDQIIAEIRSKSKEENTVEVETETTDGTSYFQIDRWIRSLRFVPS